MKKYILPTISDMAVCDRPISKIENKGAENLTDIELLSIIIGSGHKSRSLENICSSVLQNLDCPEETTIDSLKKIVGIGESIAKRIIASIELNRRHFQPKRKKISSPSDIYPLIAHYGDRQQEHFFVMTLNGAHEVINIEVVTVGILNRTIVHPREIFLKAIEDRAASIIVAHNHPSGNLEPSKEDRDVTYRLQESGMLLGIEVLDHVIFNGSGYFSFLEEGEI